MALSFLKEIQRSDLTNPVYKPMFLITTADQRTWKKDEKILFLGEWCRIYNKQKYLEQLDYEVASYHWDDRHKLYHDSQKLYDMYEHYLEILSKRLNSIHNSNYSIRYWRILIGPWLRYFIEILYDRYGSLVHACQLYEIKNTWIIDYPEWKLTPNDFSSFLSHISSDYYNHYLYAYIIEKLSLFNYEKIQTRHELDLQHCEPIGSNLGRFIKKLLNLLFSATKNQCRYVFTDRSLGFFNEFKLQTHLGQIPSFFYGVIETNYSRLNKSLREKIQLGYEKGEFEKILSSLIPSQLPKIYLEDYSRLRKRALGLYPLKPKVIYTATAQYENEGWKIWAAEKIEQGAKLFIGQHGGHYGIGLWNNNEKHEIAICDKYFSWGWDDTEKTEKIRSLSANKLIRNPQKSKSRTSGKIICILFTIPRYSYFLLSIPISASQLEVYFAEQERFIKSLCPEAKRGFILRLSPNDYNYCQYERFNKFENMVEFADLKEPLEIQLRRCRLAIVTYNATTYLETLSANIPTVIFWNPMFWELRKNANVYFDRFSKVGIFHKTPESAAEFINGIYQNPHTWWEQPEVQKVKNEFCHHYARVTKRWLQEWRLELLN